MILILMKGLLLSRPDDQAVGGAVPAWLPAMPFKVLTSPDIDEGSATQPP